MYMSCVVHGESHEGINDDNLDLYLFNMEMIPRWIKKYILPMIIGEFEIPFPIKETPHLIYNIAVLVIIFGRLKN